MRRINDYLFFSLTRVCTWLLFVAFVALVISLIVQSWPAIKTFQWHFLWSDQWNPVANEFGALPALSGTIVTAIIALILAVPISLGVAIALTQILPKTFTMIFGRLIEMMAAIPSIIYGMWGLFVFVPISAHYIEPFLLKLFKPIPLLNIIFSGVPIGISLFSAGVILAMMIIPIITAMMRDILAEVPDIIYESAYALGSTRWEINRSIILRYTRTGLWGAIVLGLGRALGETMAVTFVIGNAHRVPKGLFMPGTTISAALANEFTEATSTLYRAALVELSLILLFISFLTLLLYRLILRRAKTRGGSQ